MEILVQAKNPAYRGLCILLTKKPTADKLTQSLSSRMFDYLREPEVDTCVNFAELNEVEQVVLQGERISDWPVAAKEALLGLIKRSESQSKWEVPPLFNVPEPGDKVVRYVVYNTNAPSLPFRGKKAASMLMILWEGETSPKPAT
jgi:hypothetical protein